MTEIEFKEASAYWEEHDRTAKAADEAYIEASIEKFITGHNTCALATGCGDFVRCTPIEYMWKDGCFWLFSEGGLKFKALEKNSNVSLAIFDQYGGFGNLGGMQVTGVADVVDESSEVYDRMLQDKHVSREALRKSGHVLHLIRITPTRMDILSSEFRKDGLDSRQHIDL